MPRQELLETYLNDHLAGSAAGIDLAERLRSDLDGEPDAGTLATLAREIQEDKAELEELMERLGIERSPFKQAVGWTFEKVSRLRINRGLIGDANLTRMMEAETLSLGVAGKLAMWRVLKKVAEVDDRVATVDLDRLIERAERQRDELESLRLAAATRAFAAE